MKSPSYLLSPPPSPHPAPLPLASSSCMTGCPELDLSVTLSPTPKTGCPQLKPWPRGQMRRRMDPQVCFKEPVVVSLTPEPHVTLSSDAPQQQQKSTGHHHVPGQSAKLLAAASNQDPVCLEKAELNTTLALKADLQSLQSTGFDSQRALKEILQGSERTESLLNTRATEEVNISRSQHLFASLVSVSVQKDQIISQVMQDRLLLPTSPRYHAEKAADGPSVLHFMSSALFRQKPVQPEEEPFKYKPHPSFHSTFDLYRRQGRWEAKP